MTFRTIALLLCLLTLPRAASALDCAEISAMSRIVASRETLVSGSAQLMDTLRRLDLDLARIDGTVADRASGGMPSSVERDALHDLADLAQRINGALRRGDMAVVTRILDDAARADTLSRAGQALARLHCGRNAAADRALSEGSSTISALAPQAVEEVSRTAFYAGLATGIAAFLLAGLSALLIWRVRSRQRRRSRRFRVLHDVDMHMNDARHRGTLLDLSCFGAKLRHNGLIVDRDTRLSINLLGVVRPCRITWLNEHYAGLQFAERLRIAQVLGVAAGIAPKTPTPRMQTAPASGGRS